MLYEVGDAILFRSTKQVIVITYVWPEDQNYSFSIIDLDDIKPGYIMRHRDIESLEGELLGNKLPFETIRLLYL